MSSGQTDTDTGAKTEQIIVSLGEDKGCFHSPIISLSARPFAKTSDCIDLVSFDVGTTHLAVARIRYDRHNKRCCIVHAVQMDIYHPWRSLLLDSDFRNTDGSAKNKRQRKPAYVEPFDGSIWPPWNKCNRSLQPRPTSDSENTRQTETPLAEFHKRLLEEKRVQRDKEKSQTHRWVHDVELMPLALHNIEWLHDTDIDRVLVEQQQYDNTKMRCISYCLLDMFQTRRVCSLLLLAQNNHSSPDEQSVPALGALAALEMFPSTMKLSKWVINVLLQSWRVEIDASLTLSPAQKKEQKREQQKKREQEQERLDNNENNQDKANISAEKWPGVCDRSSDEVEKERKQKICRKPNRNNNNSVAETASESGLFLSAKRHDDLVDHATHGTKKTSAVRVLEHLFAPALPKTTESDLLVDQAIVAGNFAKGQHPLAHWLDSQRAEKHNVCDAILQAFAWLIKHEQEPAMQRIRKKRKRAVVSAKSRKKATTLTSVVITADDELTDTKHTVLLE